MSKPKEKRIYISGAITHDPGFAEKFAAAEEKLKAEGYIVYNPAKLNLLMPEETTWGEYMRMSFALLDFCSEIYMLPDWRESAGAKREHARAKNRKLTVIYEGQTT